MILLASCENDGHICLSIAEGWPGMNNQEVLG
jgi:hypothetical protein